MFLVLLTHGQVPSDPKFLGSNFGKTSCKNRAGFHLLQETCTCTSSSDVQVFCACVTEHRITITDPTTEMSVSIIAFSLITISSSVGFNSLLVLQRQIYNQSINQLIFIVAKVTEVTSRTTKVLVSTIVAVRTFLSVSWRTGVWLPWRRAPVKNSRSGGRQPEKLGCRQLTVIVHTTLCHTYIHSTHTLADPCMAKQKSTDHREDTIC